MRGRTPIPVLNTSQRVDWRRLIPGFNVIGLGGEGPSNVSEIRRKHRWEFRVIGRGTGEFAPEELVYLQSASRPSFKFEEPEMHHNQEVSRFAGKQDWDPITLVWYDVQQQPDVSAGIYKWIETVVNMSVIKVSHPTKYKRVSELAMLDGAGDATEIWRLYGTWPQACNWQELDYTSTDLQTIEATMRFDRAVRLCTPALNQYAATPSC